MISFDLNIQSKSLQPVVSKDDLSLGSMPPFIQGNSLDLKIRVVNPGPPSFYEANTGRTLRVILGTIPPGASYYTNQFSWTLSSDPADPFFEAVLPMNTTGINTLLSGKTKARAWFQIDLDDGNPRTILRKLVTVLATGISVDALVVPAPLTPLSAETADAKYLRRIIPCSSANPVIFHNTDTGKEVAAYVDGDGTWHADMIA